MIGNNMRATLTLATWLVVAGTVYVAGQAFAQEAKCLARPGIMLCIGFDEILTGDPGKDKCTIAHLDMQKAQTEQQQEVSPSELTQPSPYTHAQILQHVKDALATIGRDCP